MWQRDEIRRLVTNLNSENARRYAREIGRLTGGLIDFADDDAQSQVERQFDAVFKRTLEIGMKTDGDIRAEFVAGLDDPITQRAPESQYILVPGEHIDEHGTRTEHSLCEVTDAVLAAFAPDALYRWAGIVGMIDGNPGRKTFRIANAEHIRALVDRSCKLGRWKKTKNGAHIEYVSCPRDLANSVLTAAERHTNVRDVEMLVNYPVYLPTTGRIARPGLNPGGVYYDQPDDLRDLAPLDVSRPENNPRAALYDLIVDFPFADAASRDNFIGLLLTPILRPALKGNVPFHMVSASLERTGKSTLIETVIGNTILGDSIAAIQLSGSEDEIEKRILATMIEGSTLLHVDNVNDFIDSATIASLITGKVKKGRILGVSRMVNVKNFVTLIASANNPKATGEIAKRIVPIVLQPRTDSPETRTDFVHPNIDEYSLARRKHILGVLLGMVEAWRAAGKPMSKTPMGGFRRWTEIVGGVVQFHGFTGWMENFRTWSRETDTRGQDMRAFVAEWFSRFGAAKVRSSELWAMCQASDWFAHLTASGNEKSALTRFGIMLGRHEKTPVAGHVIRRAEIAGVRLWYLDQIAEPSAIETPKTEKQAGLYEDSENEF